MTAPLPDASSLLKNIIYFDMASQDKYVIFVDNM